MPALNEQDVRTVLLQELERERYGVLATEKKQGDQPGASRSRFLSELTRRSAGLPLYLRLVIEDIRRGGLISPSRDLPDRLDEYYRKLLDDLRITDEQAIVPYVIALLAHARSPLDGATLSRLMRTHNLREILGEGVGAKTRRRTADRACPAQAGLCVGRAGGLHSLSREFPRFPAPS